MNQYSTYSVVKSVDELGGTFIDNDGQSAPLTLFTGTLAEAIEEHLKSSSAGKVIRDSDGATAVLQFTDQLGRSCEPYVLAWLDSAGREVD